MKQVYYSDFETTIPNRKNEVFVYLWVLLKGEEVYKGFDINSWYEQVKDMDCVIYFHNLKFDFSYIHHYLLEKKIVYSICEKDGIIYSVKIGKVELRDSMNFLNMSLKDVGENYCIKYHKTSIDYQVKEGHKATEEEIIYCVNDCKVLEEGLNAYLNSLIDVLEEAECYKTIKHLPKRLTNAGIAFEAFKELSNFEKCCPKTTMKEYALFKEAYRGGFVYSNPRGIQKNVMMIDDNSMYPYIYSSIDLPIGNPIVCDSFEDMERFKFYITKVLIKYELKPGYVAIIGGGVGRYGGVEYRASSNGKYEELTICSIDLELIKKFYDCDIHFIWGRGFETCPNFFKKYADTFIAFKNKYRGAKRAVAKVMLNSPYGKTAMNGISEIKTYNLEDNIVTSEVKGYKVDPGTYQYFPMAIAITAGARRLLLTTACKIGFEDIHYMDTDSIKFTNKETGIAYNDSVLGDWKDEGLCDLFKTIAPKKYVYYHEGKIYFTCAGFSKKVLTEEMEHGKEVTYDQALELMEKFDKGLSLNCLQSKVVKGGRALLPVTKEIN